MDKTEWIIFISILALVVSIIVAIVSYNQQNDIADLTEKQIELEESQSEFNKIVKFYETLERDVNECINQSIRLKNKKLLNEARTSIFIAYNRSLAKEMLTSIEECVYEGEEEGEEIAGFAGSAWILIVIILIILVAIVWQIRSVKKMKK